MATLSLVDGTPPHEKRSESLFSQPEILPHFYYFFAQLMVVLLYGNCDINSRVAGSIPLYYWAMASFLVEGKEGKLRTMGMVAAGHNLLYMVLNWLLFPIETAFF